MAYETYGCGRMADVIGETNFSTADATGSAAPLVLNQFRSAPDGERGIMRAAVRRGADGFFLYLILDTITDEAAWVGRKEQVPSAKHSRQRQRRRRERPDATGGSLVAVDLGEEIPNSNFQTPEPAKEPVNPPM